MWFPDVVSSPRLETRPREGCGLGWAAGAAFLVKNVLFPSHRPAPPALSPSSSAPRAPEHRSRAGAWLSHDRSHARCFRTLSAQCMKL